jgi:carnitine-CoA ligase
MAGVSEFLRNTGPINDAESTANPASVDITLGAAFKEKATQEPDAVYAVFEGVTITFGDLDHRSDAIAKVIQDKGAIPGDRIITMLVNSPDCLALIFGIVKAGMVWVPVNVNQRGEGLKAIFENCDPRLAIIETELAGVLSDSGIELGRDALILHDEEVGLAFAEQGQTASMPYSVPNAKPDQHFALMYTSGTTGPPKGVIVTHRMFRLAAESSILVSDAQDHDIFFMWEPLYHIGGAQLLYLPVLKAMHLHMVKRFSASRFWQQVRDSGATQIHYLGGILQMLLAQPETNQDTDHKVRIAWGAGCQTDTFALFTKRFNVAIRECYGMTEASSITTYSTSTQPGVVGKPVPWFDVQIRDEHDQIVPNGQKGQIVVSQKTSGGLFPGYFRQADATRKALQNGTLYTGDLGSLDEAGMLRFHGRQSDSVRCRGENISAWEVEHVVLKHPAVEECAIIGVAAQIGEQDIKLFVRLKDGESLSQDALCDWLEPRLAKYMMPRYVVFADDFERTGSQRIIKRKLSSEIAGCWDRLALSKSA